MFLCYAHYTDSNGMELIFTVKSPADSQPASDWQQLVLLLLSEINAWSINCTGLIGLNAVFVVEFLMKSKWQRES
jgi:hypothetical protein